MEQFANNAQTTLASSITSGSGSVTVVSAAGFPTVPQFRLRIGLELLLVTAIAGNVFTVARAQESTLAAAASAGDTVTHVLTRGALDQFRADSIMGAAASALPAPGNAGRLYLPADSAGILLDSGSAWNGFGPTFPLTPPNDSTFSWINQAIAATVQANVRQPVWLSTAQNLTISLNCRVKNVPGGTYDIRMAFSALWPANTCEAGIVLADGSNKLCCLRLLSPTQGSNIWAGYFNSPTSFNANIGTPAPYVFIGSGLIWMRLVEDGVKRTMYAGLDGRNWLQVVQVPTNDFLTPTRYGYYLDDHGGAAPAGILIHHFSP